MTISAEAPGLREIALRLSALPEDKQRLFEQRLRERGIEPASLPIVAQPRPERIALSSAQERIWLADKLQDQAGAYHLCLAFALRGPLQRTALQAALDALIARHEALRTSFHEDERGAFQAIAAHASAPLAALDLSQLPGDQRATRAREASEETVREPFDLARAPLLRALLIRFSAVEHRLVLTLHHVVSDEWSNELLFGELLELYAANEGGRAPELPAPGLQYPDYALWERRWNGERALGAQLEHWKSVLSDEEHGLRLPRDRAEAGNAADEVAFGLDPELTRQVRALAQALGITPFMACLGAFLLLLARYSGQADIRVGSPIANRRRAELEGVVGFFANTLVLRAHVDGRDRVRSFLQQVRDVVGDAQSNQELALERLASALQAQRGPRSARLFEVMFSWHREPPARMRAGAIELAAEPFAERQARFDLTLHMTEGDATIAGAFVFRTGAFSRGSASAMARRYRTLLASMLRDPDVRLCALAWLEPQELAWVDGVARPSRAQHNRALLHERVAEHAARRPHAPAIASDEGTASFAELCERAATLAERLRALGVGLETRVGLRSTRSLDFAIAALAIMKCGGAYVPLEAKLAPARIKRFVTGAPCALIVDTTAEPCAEHAVGCPVLALTPSALEPGVTTEPHALVHPESAAYVIFTSGSTGEPKGVVISHAALASYVDAALERLALPGECSLAMVSTIGADLGHTALFAGLSDGRCVHLLGEALAFDPDAFGAYMRAHAVGALKIVPSHLAALLQASDPAAVLPRDALILGGETAALELVERVRSLSTCRVVNHYGPTETTVGVLTHEHDRTRAYEGSGLPLGLPLSHAAVYVLGPDLEPVPSGVVGEIFIAGAGVARGYAQRPQLSAERFLPDPHGEAGGRMYRSGDLGRRLPDGPIEFLGRSDDQIKLRGHRVELEEIRVQLLAQAGVRDACVLVRRAASDAQRLVAYLVPAAVSAREAELREALARELPEYMVPAELGFLDALPLTPNGKLDRNALLALASASDAARESRGSADAVDGRAPSLGEQTLLAIWRELLRSEQIALHDNFFQLGGDSILALQFVARARRAGFTVTPRTLFDHPTIASLARNLGRATESVVAQSEAQSSATGALLTPIQRAFFEAERPNRNHENQSLLLHAAQPLDRDALRAALAAVLARHASLRCVFAPAQPGGELGQRPLPEIAVDALLWEREVADAAGIGAVSGEAQRSLDIARGPVLRVAHMRHGDGSARLLIAAHHLVVDTVSFRILLEDLSEAYACALRGERPALAATASYAAFSLALHARALAPDVRAELAFWREQLESAVPLACDDPSGRAEARDEDQVGVVLDALATERLLRQAPRAYRTQINDLLLVALARALLRWSGASPVIELEGHGREPGVDALDVTRTTGWFTTKYPLRIDGSGRLGAAICRVKEQLRAVPAGGLGYGLLRYLADDETRAALAALPRPDVTFNYLGQLDAVLTSGPLSLAEESPGPERDERAPLARALEVSGEVLHGQLSLRVAFSRQRFARARVTQLAQVLRDELTAVIDHCTREGAGAATPSDFPLAGLSQAELDRLPLRMSDVEDLYPLTPVQQGILLHARLEADAGLYVNQQRIRVHGLDLARLRAAWARAIARHEMLRSAIVCDAELEHPLQVVYRSAPVPLELRDLRASAAPDVELRALAARERERGIDLSRPPLLRVVFALLGEHHGELVWTSHHVATDGWSSARLMAELVQDVSGDAALAGPYARYRDYVTWLARQDRAASREYFQRVLARSEGPTVLARVVAAGADPGAEVAHGFVQIHLSAAESAQIARAAQREQVTVNTLVQAAWALVLSRYTGQRTVVFGVTSSGRPAGLAGAETMLGVFINTLPLVASLERARPVGEWLRQLQRDNAALREHEHAPLSDALGAVALPSGEQGADRELFDTLLVFGNYPLDPALGAGGTRFELIENRETTNYALTIDVSVADTMQIALTHDLRRLGAPIVESIAAQLGATLARIAEHPLRTADQLSILSPAEQAALDADNATDRAFPFELGFARLFERRAAMHGDRIAARDLEQTLNYVELELRSRRVAQALRAAGLAPGEIVPCRATRDVGLLTLLVGTLRAGGAYLPIDEQQPAERVQHMLSAARARVVLTDRAQLAALQALARDAARPLRCVVLEDVLDADASYDRVELPSAPTAPDDLAYALFTSGSTGLPKGVLVTQRGMLNNQLSKVELLGLGPSSAIAQTAAPAFDISVWQLLAGLLCGARIEIVPDAITRDPERLIAHAREREVSVLEIVPALLREVLERDPGALPSLRWLLPTGEALPIDLANRWLERYPEIPLVNAYGPAECADDVALHCMTAPQPASDTGYAAIGRATDNTRLYVVDRDLRQVPAGVVGQLAVAGAGVGWGYLGRPELTAVAFVPSPFGEAGERMYLTGDLCRRDFAGTLHFVGRADHQVKIHGHRIELGEIEAALLEQPSVAACAVVAQDGVHGKRLVAYVVRRVGSAAEPFAPDALLAGLARTLPRYMVPAVLVPLERLPLTANGKLDRAALPAPALAQRAREQRAPGTPSEHALARIWREVLEIEQVGLLDNFFELGGHSLLATKVVARVRKERGVELPLRALFDSANLGELARLSEQLERGGQDDAIPLVRRAGPLPLSSAQRRLWLLSELEPDSSAYNVGDAVRVLGELCLHDLEASFSAVIARHEALRTRFVAQDGDAQQVVDPPFAFRLAVVDASEQPQDEREAFVRAQIEAETGRPFDLARGPLLRARAVRLNEREHVLILTLHHLVCDEWSMQLLIRELLAAYAAGKDAGHRLAPLPIQYPDYALWQHARLQGPALARDLAYFVSALGDEHPVLELPSDRPRPRRRSYAGAVHRFALDAELVRVLRELGTRHRATLFMVVLAAFKVWLARHTGQGLVRVGVPHAGRQRVELEPLIGFFVGTHVLQARLDDDPTFEILLGRVREAALGAQAHAELPFERLVEALNPPRSLDHPPLYQVGYNHQFANYRALEQLAGLRIEPCPQTTAPAKLDLSLEVFEHPDGEVDGYFTYRTDLFDASTVAAFEQRLQTLLASVARSPAGRVGLLPMLARDERHDLLARSLDGRHATAPWDGALLLDRIEAAFAGRAHADAVVCGAERLSFALLAARSDALAARLAQLGVGEESRVAICLPRSTDVLVAIFAVWKAGGAYVFLDPQYPAARLDEMLVDARVRVLLTAASVDNAPARETLLRLDVALDTPPRESAASFQRRAPDPAAAAYIVYTSGSTGKPKGVVVAHGAIAMHCAAAGAIYGLGARDAALHLASLSFDASIEQWAVPLASGAKLVLSEDGPVSAEQLCALAEREGLTLVYPPTSYVDALAEHVARTGHPLRLSICCVGGEAVPLEKVERISRALGCRVINGYGPTETVVTPLLWSSSDGAGHATAYAPIGQAVGDRTAYVLDPQLGLVPDGAIGELYIGGTGLARGYQARPALTAERFVPDPFCGHSGARMYRTGDRVRRMRGGAIEFLGRSDQQVKLRGFRIELGEVEAQLLAQPGVVDGVAIVRDAGVAAQLVAYVVMDEQSTSSDPAALGESLRAALRQALPEPLVPARIVVLEALPRTLNGKVDRRALPVPALTTSEDARPRTAQEHVLGVIWSELLAVSAIGLRDNFFELGGDSILALQIVSRARAAGLLVTARQLFEHPTLEGLAGVAIGETSAPAVREPATGSVPLTPIQHRFFELPLANRNHWNQSLLLHADQPIAVERLRGALAAMVSRHDALRLRYRWQSSAQRSAQGTAVEQFYAQAPVVDELLWQRTVASAAEITALTEQAQRSLDLERGPLLRVVTMAHMNGSSRLFIAIHHLVVDAVSWRVLLEELEQAYAAAGAGSGPVALAGTDSYQAWSRKLGELASDPELLAELGYWQSGLAGAAPLACAAPHGRAEVRDEESVSFALDRESTARLLKDAPRAYRTQINDLLLCALARAVASWQDRQGASPVLVELEGHGREDSVRGADVSRTVGWFTASAPVCLDGSGELGAAICRVKEALRAVPSRGIGYGVLRHLASPAVRAEMQALPRAQITFNYFGQLDGALAAGRWRPADEPAFVDRDPSAPLENQLVVSGEVLAGVLALRVSYSRQQRTREDAQRFASAYEAELRALIAHCAERQASSATPSDFPLVQVAQAELDRFPFPLADVETVLPLAPLQEGILFHALHEQGGNAYVNQLRVRVTGLDPTRFAAAYRRALERHEALRTCILAGGELASPVQVVLRAVDSPVQILDWRGRASEDALAALAARELAAGIELSRAPLMRVLLVRTSDEQCELIWTLHHVMLDGWSSGRLIAELLRAATAHASVDAVLEPAAGRYRDYLAWLAQRDQRSAERFFREQLRGLDEPTLLAAAVSAAGVGVGHGVHALSLDRACSARLIAAAQRERVTLNTLVQAGWALLLKRYTGKASVAFGITSAGRPAELAGAETTLGLFINTLPVVETPPESEQVGAWLRALQRRSAELREHEHTPLHAIQRWSPLAAAGGDRALFDTLLVFENYPVDEALLAGGGGLSFGDARSDESTHYALTLDVSAGEAIRCNFGYQRAQLDAAAVEAIASRLVRLLEAIADSPTQRVAALSILSASERTRLAALAIESQGAAAWTGASVVAAIARAWTGRAHVDAVVCGEQRLRYSELERRSVAIAATLRARGAGPETRIGVCSERSVDAIAAMLGVWKAGAAYVPLPLDYPEAQLLAMIADSGVRAVLASARGASLLAGADLGALALLDLQAAAAEGSGGQVVAVPASDAAAYVIYTSGSTGKPKGVVVSHRAVAMHGASACAIYGLTGADAALHLASLGFDAAVEQWIVPLMSGAKLVLRDEPLLDGNALRALVARERITLVYPPTPYIDALVEQVESSGQALSVATCCVGGEAVASDKVARTARVLGARVINGYGPTETVITPLLWVAPRAGAQATSYAPIGRAVGDRTTYVVDGELALVPEGMVGELCIGGSGLARGYHGRPDLTAERFVPDPFTSRSGARMYRTGDLVRRLASGDIEYLGRADGQVKIRGHRIELGEVEARLLADDRIAEAVAVARGETGRKRLLAYVVARTPLDAARRTELAASVRERLRRAVAEHSVPSELIVLDALPRTAHGKVDRARLPELASDSAALAERRRRDFVAPRDAQQAALAAIWAELLRVERVGLRDNFFELGGDSILALQLVGRARRAGLVISTRDLFERPTVEGLAAIARVLTETAVEDLARGEVPLLPIQRAFFARALPEPNHFNQALLLSTARALDSAALRSALRALVDRHPALAMRYEAGAHGVVQRYGTLAPGVELLREQMVSTTAEITASSDAAQRGLDLGCGPLLRAVHMTCADGSARLLLVVHHLVVDGVSWRILLEDLGLAYQQASAGEAIALPPATASYKAWARQLEQHARSAAVQAEVPYWQETLASLTPLRCERPEGRAQADDEAAFELRFDADSTTRLLREAPRAYRTHVNDLLLTALARALHATTGRSVAHVMLEGHGREALPDADEARAELDLSRIVGWFTTRFPVRLTAGGEIGAAIRTVKEQLRAVPQRGLGYGLLRHLGEGSDSAALRELPEPDISFNYLGQLDGALAAGPFAAADEASGPERDERTPMDARLEINGEVLGGLLALRFTYSREQFEPATIERIARAYEQALHEVIAHAASGHVRSATPSDFPLTALSQLELDRFPVPLDAVEDLYRLTPMQEGMLFHSLHAPDSRAYVNQLRVRVGGLDAQAFTAAFRAAMERHEVLRTSIAWGAGLSRPVQVVHRDVRDAVEVLDLRAREVSDDELAAIAEREHARGIDLAAPPLVRVLVVRLSERQSELVCTLHHALLDGWSTARLIAEVLRVASGDAMAGMTAPGRYRSYVEWLARQDRAASERYFRSLLASVEQPTLLSAALPAERTAPGHGLLRRELDDRASARLRAAAQREQVTLNTFVQAAWALVLQRQLGQQPVVFGVTSSGRPESLPGAEDMLGLFINTLPCIEVVPSSTAVGAWLRALQRRSVELRAHEHMPLYEVQRCAPSSALGGRDRALFDTLLVFENYPIDETLGAGADALELGAARSLETTSYPLTIDAATGARLQLAFSYARDRFDDSAIELIANRTLLALEALASDPERSVGGIELLTAAEQSALALQNESERAHPLERGFFALLQERAARHPERVAASHRDESLSHGELELRARRVVHALRANGIRPGDVVACYGERDLGLLTMLCGTLAHGAAYLPLDPEQPTERLAPMLHDTRATAVLTDRSSLAACQELIAIHAPGCKLIALDDALAGPAALPQSVAPPPPNALAYVLFTSGSTGRPKGAQVTVAGMLNNQWSKIPALQLGEGDVIAQTASQGFDISVWQLLTALWCGARVEIVPSDVVRSPRALIEHVRARGVTVLQLVPALLRAVLDQQPAMDTPALRVVLPTGEALPWETVRDWFERHPQIPLVNAYGPAECADDVALQRLASCPPRPATGYAAIGVPTDNNRLYLVDGGMRRVPAGVVGELCVAGVGVGLGYAGRPELTAAAFVPHPWGEPGERLYRTGDLGRIDDDGVLHFVGRCDHQVKISGHRIELGEIEARLLELPGVREAVATAVDAPGGGKRLVAHVSRSDGSSGELAWKDALARVLPRFMLPSLVSVLPQLPRSANGKIDRAALATPQLAPRVPVAPRTALEQSVARIWQELLACGEVSLDHDFFELGGHSLLAVRVAQRIEEEHGFAPALATVLAASTLGELCAALERDQGGAARDVLVRLGRGTADRPRVYCLHPSGGHVLGYRALAAALADRYALIGVQARWLFEDGWDGAALDQIAERYAAAIAAAESESTPRPLMLAGFSFGAALALEVARALERRGERVALVASIDGADLLAAAPLQPPADWSDAQHAAAKLRLQAWIAQARRPARWQALLSRASGEAERWLVARFAEHEAELAGADLARESEWFGHATSSLLIEGYRARAIAAPLHVFWSEQTVRAVGGAALSAFARTLEHASSRTLPGDHDSIMASAALHTALRTALLSYTDGPHQITPLPGADR